eukprot:CAMPEP_0175210764 /NCGR_PEP_ID=MMETSP0093-20121207/14812_1 /TAXON_ID=311494 /ORGANISM="Alexandrium monilatum, Strain CCMP3105" /LENGTH=56 /DNA_ID=CAMNT_0016504001 /DNA_START=14 /DNA_END=181 /DNA_ORIENTATION=+
MASTFSDCIATRNGREPRQLGGSPLANATGEDLAGACKCAAADAADHCMAKPTKPT